ncbi:MAG TPA: aldehyde dehydrogenase [Opitutus sp.]|nr:aldehyde dehydrogenase [Opitutus sp.]
MPSLTLDESVVRSVVEEVLRNFTRPGVTLASGSAPAVVRATGPRLGVFPDAPSAVAAAQAAYRQLCDKGVAARAKVVEIVKTLCSDKAVEWGQFEFAETKIGRLDHKIEKLQIVKLVPGVEWLRPDARSGDHGITLEEYTPYGVVAAILPMTHSIPTLAGNVINIVAAGNAVVFNPHPGGARSAALAVRAFNEAIQAATGIENLVCTVEQPSLDSFNALCQAPEVRVLCVTGGPAVVAAAMKSGKRAICAGPGNPPVLVDGTRDLDAAARDIIHGAAYDNNLLCIGEKEVFVLDTVADAFLAALARRGARQLNAAQLDKLTAAAFTTKADAGGCSHPVLNRALVGVDAAVLARHAGTEVSADTPLLFAETDASHAFVVEEQMMPMLPIVRVKSVEEGVQAALRAEHGYKHSAIIHSLNVDHMTLMARALDTTIFIKNGACVAGLGLGGEGYLSYSIATTTGEGITTPRTFTRTRRCVMVDNLKIY